ncbi:hypothetical protein [Paramicrobacterium agarici]|uniref:hypothetical protein n=1 Tax=Paramicrobacterium agarici TaxID=630514 RepID=UPI00114E8EF0|nr:hypothetical protein [Microbacterium agarici]TQO24282.1 hypothetical protein FB385_3162 [Microbacterium agarici]
MGASDELTIGGATDVDLSLDLWLKQELSSEQWRWCNNGGAEDVVFGHVLAVAELVSLTAGAHSDSSWLWTRISNDGTMAQFAGGAAFPGKVILEVGTASGWNSVTLDAIGSGQPRTTRLTGDPRWELFLDPRADLLTTTQAAYAVVAWMRDWDMPGLAFGAPFPAAPRR